MYVDVTVKWIQKLDPDTYEGVRLTDAETCSAYANELQQYPECVADMVARTRYTVDVHESEAAYLLRGDFKGWHYEVATRVNGHICRIRHLDPAGWVATFPLPERTSEWLPEIHYRIGQASRG